jgi:hypothetical protein
LVSFTLLQRYCIPIVSRFPPILCDPH